MPRPDTAGRPVRIVLLRSGRHLQTALSTLRRRWPGCEVAVVGTRGSETAIAEAGVPPGNTFVYARRPRFTPLAFLCSATALRLRAWRFDRVAILWNDPDGAGQGNVDRTALTLAPSGFVAVTPDGRLVERRACPQVQLECKRAIVSLGAAVVLGALYLPALILAPFGRRT
jgi:hypothetical protein